MKVILLLGVIALLGQCQGQSVPGDFCNDKPLDANYNHPTVCNAYVQCTPDGSAYVLSCPIGYSFNESPRPYGHCEPDASCNPEATTPSPVDPQFCEGKQLDANYYHPSDPTLYVLCASDGTNYVMPCPSGLYFTETPRPYGQCEFR